MGVSATCIYGEVTSIDVIARYVATLGGRLDLVADFGDAPDERGRRAPGCSPRWFRAGC